MIAVNVDEKAEELSLGLHERSFIWPIMWGFLAPMTGPRMAGVFCSRSPPSGAVPLTLVTNWDAELKK